MRRRRQHVDDETGKVEHLAIPAGDPAARNDPLGGEHANRRLGLAQRPVSFRLDQARLVEIKRGDELGSRVVGQLRPAAFVLSMMSLVLPVPPCVSPVARISLV
jgi:hypothetical protein